MAKRSLPFFSNRENWPGNVAHLNDLIEGSIEVTSRSFFANVKVEEVRLLQEEIGYRKGSPIESDPLVTFHRGKIEGKWAYYFVWSAIEFVFTDWRPTV